jgi:hypothetical protein
VLPASSKGQLQSPTAVTGTGRTGPPLVRLLLFLGRQNEDQNNKNHSQPRYLIIPTSAWSLNLDRPPGLKKNLLLVNHTHVCQITLYNEVTDWVIFIVIVSRIDILSLLLETFL